MWIFYIVATSQEPHAFNIQFICIRAVSNKNGNGCCPKQGSNSYYSCHSNAFKSLTVSYTSDCKRLPQIIIHKKNRLFDSRLTTTSYSKMISIDVLH